MSRYLYSFGPFQLDTEQKVLLRDGQNLSLKPKVFDLLVVLVENSGRVVSKDDLLKKVWMGSFVEEGNLAVSIVKLRQALGETHNEHPYIETVARRGYRFVASVTEILVHSANTIVPPRFGRSNSYGVIGKGTIAVLPLNSIGKAGNKYLGLGLADALITKLSNLRNVTVRPTSSIRKYERAGDPVAAGRDLCVEYVLDGSVRRMGRGIRVTVQLVNVADGVVLWAEKFDELFTNIFSVEDSISEQVARALAARLTGKEKRLLARRYTDNAAAYEAYLEGRYFFEKRTSEGCKKAIECFEQAIRTDSSYAMAHAGLAHCYIVLGSYKTSFPNDYTAIAEQSILRALDLDWDLAEAHASLGSLKTRQWDWLGAEREYKSAIRLNPNYATARVAYALHLGITRDSNEALLEIKTAQEIDPLSLPMNAAMGSLLYMARRYDEAIDQLHRTLALDADFAIAHFCLGYAYEAQGNYEEAVKAYQRSRRGLGNIPELSSCLGRIHALSGRRDKALEAVKSGHPSKNGFVQPYSTALLFAALGDKDEAFRWLENAYAEHDEDLFLVKVDPRLDCLRGDSRLTSLLQRMGLAEPSHRKLSDEH